jgi:hypothetical protein
MSWYIISYDISYHIIYIIILYYFILLYIICYVRSLIILRCNSYVPPTNGSRTSTQKYKNVWVTLNNKRSIFVHIHVFRNKNYLSRYIRIASTKSPSFSIITFSVLLTNCRVLLPQPHDYCCYVSRRKLATPQLWLHKHTDLGTTKPSLSTCDMSPVSVMLSWSGPSVHVQLILLHQAAHIRKNRDLDFIKHKAAVLTGIICYSTA